MIRKIEIITSLILIVAIVLILNGCTIDIENANEKAQQYEESVNQNLANQQNAKHNILADDQFEKLTITKGTTIFDANDFILYRHTYTDVIYIAMRGKHEYVISVMYNADGKPMLYSEWLQYIDK